VLENICVKFESVQSFVSNKIEQIRTFAFEYQLSLGTSNSTNICSLENERSRILERRCNGGLHNVQSMYVYTMLSMKF
jgi:hypothetical protein